MLTPPQKRELVSSRDWWHSIDVGDGIVTPGTVNAPYLQSLLDTLQLPETMTGLRVLDIGTMDGYFAFECERRGAEVVAIDVFPEDARCFALAKNGVFYHLRHPFVALDNLWRITRGEMRVETHVIDHHFILDDGSVVELASIDPRLTRVPIYRFYRFNELNKDDYSNWFGGNVAAVMESLASAGFAPELLGTWASRAAFRASKIPDTPREWEIGSYEGMRFTIHSDGTWTSHWFDPKKHHLPDRKR
jgi:hypothetical protein